MCDSGQLENQSYISEEGKNKEKERLVRIDFSILDSKQAHTLLLDYGFPPIDPHCQ